MRLGPTWLISVFLSHNIIFMVRITESIHFDGRLTRVLGDREEDIHLKVAQDVLLYVCFAGTYLKQFA